MAVGENELFGIKSRSSVLVRGFSAMEIAKQAGLIPGNWNEDQFIDWLKEGEDGWSPIFAASETGTRTIMAVSDWYGGTGNKPPTGYIGPDGLTGDINAATNFQGEDAYEVWERQPGNAGKTEAEYLEWLADAQVAEVTAAVQPMVDAAEAAQAAAEAAQAVSEAAAAAAQSSENDAEAAQAAAEAARDIAVASKVAAELAETHAETAQGLAEAARDAALASEVAAQSSEDDAEAAQAAAVAAKVAAEAAAANAETARAAAVVAKTAAETAKTAAETARDAALAHANAADADRIAAQTAKTAAELAETNAETAQGLAEAARDAAVTARNAAQLAKTNAETAETNAETAEASAQAALAAVLAAIAAMKKPLSDMVGLEMSATGTTSLTIGAGRCADDTGAVVMVRAASGTKVGAAAGGAWSAGNAGGFLDTGVMSSGAGVWYHVWLIGKADGTTDIIGKLAVAGADPAAPVMPSGYIYKRRIGTVAWLSSNVFLSFVQIGDEFTFPNALTSINAVPQGTSPGTHVLAVPLGIQVEARLYAMINSDNAGVGCRVYSMATQQDETINNGRHQLITQAANQYVSAQILVRTNKSQQVRAVSNATTQTCLLYINIYGWIDRRGRDGGT